MEGRAFKGNQKERSEDGKSRSEKGLDADE